MQAEYTAITAQAVELGKRKAAWDYRYQRAVCLRDSVFYGASCTGIGSRIVTAPPPEPDVVPATGGGFWIVYAKGGFEWLTDIKKTKARGTVLNRNGTTMTIDPPQKKPVKKKPK